MRHMPALYPTSCPRCRLRSHLGLVLAALPLVAQQRAIDTQRSTITIHVGKAGLFSAAAHEHWVNAPVASGAIEEGGAPTVTFTVRSAQLMVKPDPKVDAKKHDQIQKDMEEMTLETAKFPEIAFRSNHVEAHAEGQFKVDGTLNLHGVSKPVSANMKREGEAYTGHAVIRQTDFGIKPISLGGGLIRIKDALDIDFQIFAHPR